MEAFLTKILGIIKYTAKFFVIVAIGSGLLLFSKKEFIEKLGMLQTVTDYKQYIGIAFFVSGLVSVSNIITFIYKKITSKIWSKKARRIQENRLHSLNPMEKNILLHYFIHGTNTQALPINDGTVRELEGYEIIQRTSQLSQMGVNFPYNLNPWVRDYITKNPELLRIDEVEAELIRRELDRAGWNW